MSGTWLGFVALLLVVGAGVLWFRAAFAVRLPKNRAGFVTVWLAGGLLGAVALGLGAGWFGGAAAGLSIVGAGFLLFTFSISRQKVAAGAISVGDPLPEFSAPDDNGDRFDSASLSGHPVLIKFFRGHW